MAKKKLAKKNVVTKKAAPKKKKKKKKTSLPTTPTKSSTPSAAGGSSDSSTAKTKRVVVTDPNTLKAHAEKARSRSKKSTRKSEDGYGPDDVPDRSEQRPAEYEPRTERNRAPRRVSMRCIWEKRFFTMLCAVTNRRCGAHIELESLRDNFKGDKVKHFKQLIELWFGIYDEASAREHELMAIVTKEFPDFKPPPQVLNWPHIVSKPPNMENAIEEIDSEEYEDGNYAGPTFETSGQEAKG